MKVTDFKGRLAYITGGSSGIGLATARLLAAKGASVIIFSRNEDMLKHALEDINKCRILPNQRFAYIQMDVGNRETCERELTKTVNEFGQPDILINSAGISYPRKFGEIPYQIFDDIIKVNLYGTWNTIDILLPSLKQEKGYIVNISSIAGLIGIFAMTAYSASKYAVIGFSEALRSELKPHGVNVAVLCPPDVNTPLMQKADKIKPEEAKAISASAHIMTAEEVAAALVRALGRDDFMIIPNTSGKFIHIAKRFFPGLTERVIDRTIRKAQLKGLKS